MFVLSIQYRHGELRVRGVPAASRGERRGRNSAISEASFALGLLVGLNSEAKYQLGLPVELLRGVAGKREPELMLVVVIFFFN